MRDDRRIPHPLDRRARTPDRRDRRGRRGTALARPDPGGRRDRARTTPPPRSGRPAGPPSSGPMPRSSWRPTTTGRTAGCSRRISGRSPTRATCRSSSTTSRRGPARTSMPIRSCGWPSIRVSWRSRRRAATSSRSPGSAATGRAMSRSSPATTPGRCRSSRWAATASSRWHRTRSPASSWRCARPRWPATGTRPGGSTTAGSRSSSATSGAARTRSR